MKFLRTHSLASPEFSGDVEHPIPAIDAKIPWRVVGTSSPKYLWPSAIYPSLRSRKNDDEVLHLVHEPQNC